jgi:hypothetical protein
MKCAELGICCTMPCGDDNSSKRILTVEHSVKGGVKPVSEADHREILTRSPDFRQTMPDALLPTALDSCDIGDNSCRSVRTRTHPAHCGGHRCLRTASVVLIR